MRIRLTLEYDGSHYHGWQRQASELPTVQGELEHALGGYLRSLTKKYAQPNVASPEITASGRTDAGVHAFGQVAHFDWPTNLTLNQHKLLSALNGMTRSSISIRSLECVEKEFHSRLSPHLKMYRYRIKIGRRSIGRSCAWVQSRPLDLRSMIAAAKYFSGQHDFSSFRAKDCTAKTTVRTVVRCGWSRPSEDEIVFFIIGKGFLKQMVRIIVGTLVEVGKGRRAPEDIPKLISARNRSLAGETAPAHGLYLDWVRYETLVSKK